MECQFLVLELLLSVEHRRPKLLEAGCLRCLPNTNDENEKQNIKMNNDLNLTAECQILVPVVSPFSFLLQYP